MPSGGVAGGQWSEPRHSPSDGDGGGGDGGGDSGRGGSGGDGGGGDGGGIDAMHTVQLTLVNIQLTPSEHPVNIQSTSRIFVHSCKEMIHFMRVRDKNICFI